MARIGDGCQVGAMTHRAALPPLLPFNLDPDEHFHQALQRAQQPLPYEDLPVADLDLEYVAAAYAAPRKVAFMEAARCGSTARVEKTLGGGDPPFEVFSRTNSASSHQES